MPPSRVCLALFALALAAPLRAEPPPPDAFGDPLPDGARARLGTVRFRPADSVNSLAWSPDGKRLAALGHGRVQLWDADGRLLREWPHHYAYRAAFTDDGKALLVAGSGEASTRLYDLAAEKEFRQVIPTGPSAQRFAFSGGHKRIFLTDPNATTVHLWDGDAGKELRSWKVDPKGVNDVALTPDGKVAVSAGYDHVVRAWDADTGKELWSVAPGPWARTRLAVSPDGTLLAHGDGDQLLFLREPTTGKEMRRLKGITWASGYLTFSADGKRLAAVGGGPTVGVWDVATGNRLHSFKAHRAWLNTLAFSPDGKRLASAGTDGAIRVWDLAAGKELTDTGAPQGEITRLIFSPDGKELFGQAEDGTLRVWDPATGKERRRLTGSVAHAVSLCCSPDGKRLLGVHNGYVRLWEAGTGKELKPAGDLALATNQYLCAVFSPDGTEVLAGAGLYSTVHVWDAATGKQLRELKEAGSSSVLALSPDGRRLLAAGGMDGRAALCDAATGKKLHSLPDMPWWNTRVSDARFSPDGRLVVTVNGGVRLWDAATGKDGVRLRDGQPCYLAVFSPDGKTLVTDNAYGSSADGTVTLWEVATGQVRCTFKGHRGSVRAVAFSPDGTMLATGGGDTSVLLWDLTGRTKHAPADPGKVADAELASLWDDLAGEDAVRAYDAAGKLSARVPQAVAFLRERLPPVSTARVGRLIADLDDEKAAVREKATDELDGLAEAAETALRQALKNGPPSAEAATRIKAVLAGIETRRQAGPSPRQLRAIRAIEALERNGGPEARRLLEELAKGAPEADLTQDAVAARKRLSRR
jgi:WD40 repeat protein